MLPLRDSTSDMAVIAKNGSKLVKEVREKKEQNKSRQRFWEMAGSKMGKITGGSLAADSPSEDFALDCQSASNELLWPVVWGQFKYSKICNLASFIFRSVRKLLRSLR